MKSGMPAITTGVFGGCRSVFEGALQVQHAWNSATPDSQFPEGFRSSTANQYSWSAPPQVRAAMRRYRGCINGRSTTFVHRARSAHTVSAQWPLTAHTGRGTAGSSRGPICLRSKGKLLTVSTWITKLHRRSVARSPSTPLFSPHPLKPP